VIVVEQPQLTELGDEVLEIIELDRHDAPHQQRLPDLRERALTIERVEHGLIVSLDGERLGELERITQDQQILVAATQALPLESPQLGSGHVTTMPASRARRPRVTSGAVAWRVRAGFLLLAVLAGPAPPPTVAVQWREAAQQPDEDLRRSVREAVAAHDDRPPSSVSDRALEQARVAVSRELPIELRAVQVAVRASLDRADEAYREGRFDDALLELTAALRSLHDGPALPGAAASAREAHLLAAKIAWARSDRPTAELALGDALRLDPEAQLSVREAAPELVGRYLELQAELLAGREATWIEPSITLATLATARAGMEGPRTSQAIAETEIEIEVEIDAVPGRRPVPPGSHFIVVHRDGHEPVAAWHDVANPWVLPPAKPRLGDDPDHTIDEVCEVLGLDLLIMAERRDALVGLQALRCGVGLGPLWTGAPEQLAVGVAAVLAGPFDGHSLTLAGETWPVAVRVPAIPQGPVDPPRPWFRRGWIWGTSASVTAAIVGGVVAGIVLANREPPPAMLDIDSNDFIGGW
jgi:hypothetical protein